jgi:methyltransferase-like protein 6
VGDLAEERFAAEGKQQRLGPNFFVRGDGTQAYYFSEAS